MLTLRKAIALVRFCRRSRYLGRADVREALRQLKAGESVAVLKRRLREWHDEYRRVARCESRDAARIEDLYYR